MKATVSSSAVCLLPTLTPLVAAALSAYSKRRYFAYHLVCIGLGVANLLILLFLDVGPFTVEGLGGALSLTYGGYTWFFLLLVNLTWVITFTYSYSYVQHHFRERPQRFYFFLSTSISAVSLVALAGNVLTVYVAYVLELLVGYYLVTLRGDANARKIGGLYLRSTLLPAFLIVAPLSAYLFGATGNAPFLALQAAQPHAVEPNGLLLAMLILGIGLNVVFPFNKWLPEAWQTPAPVTALLHSVAAVNLGAIILTKYIVYVFGRENIHAATAQFLNSGWLLYVLGLNAVYAAYSAYRTRNLKQRFTFSTVSQISYIITALLIGTHWSTVSAFLHMFSHGIAKMGLLFIAGYYNIRAGTVDIPTLTPYIRSTKMISGVVVLFGLSIIGVPFLAGSYSKDMMIIEEWNAEQYAAAVFLILGSVINALYIWPVFKTAFLQREPAEAKALPLPLSMRLALVLCVALVVLFSLYMPFIAAQIL